MSSRSFEKKCQKTVTLTFLPKQKTYATNDLPQIQHYLHKRYLTESRRDQEEIGELDSHEEVSREEIKSTEVELGLRVGLLLLQSFPNGAATDIVFVTLFCKAVGTAIAWCGGCCAMLDNRNILLFWRRSTAASVFWVGTCFEVSLFCPPFPTRPRP